MNPLIFVDIHRTGKEETLQSMVSEFELVKLVLHYIKIEEHKDGA